MKNIKKAFLTLALFLGLSFIAVSCYEPSPLYGTWEDNVGNKISFVSDGTYVANIYNTTTGATTSYEGDYTVMDNVLIFGTSSGSVKTEWDVRGNILYCTWGKNQLTLFHTQK